MAVTDNKHYLRENAMNMIKHALLPEKDMDDPSHARNSYNSHDLIEKATYNQWMASNPRHLIWVNASAGSGKTKCLIDRILRLLLTKQDPKKILAITFTNAAAIEIGERAVKAISDLVHDPCKRDEAIQKWSLLDYHVSAEALHHFCEKLYYQLLMEPLPIQTLHSYAQSILIHISSDDGQLSHPELCLPHHAEDLFKTAFFNAMKDPVFTSIKRFFAHFFTPDQLLSLSHSFFTHKKNALLLFREKGHKQKTHQALERAMKDMQSSITDFLSHMDYFNQSVFSPVDQDIQNGNNTEQKLWKNHHHLYKKNISVCGKKKDDIGGFATYLGQIMMDIEAYASLFLRYDRKNQQWVQRKTLFSVKTRKKHPTWNQLMEQAILDMEALWRQCLIHQNHFRSMLMSYYYMHVLDHYDEIKSRHHKIDFDDFIIQALAHLKKERDFLRFKLFQDLDHILLDEAQDTSGDQWQLWRIIVDLMYDRPPSENLQAMGLKERDDIHEDRQHGGMTGDNIMVESDLLSKSFFVVGDHKQSIYRFQGADPSFYFAENKRLAECHSTRFQNIHLDVNFRSCPEIIDFVNAVFEPSEGKSILHHFTHHEAARSKDAGSVRLWPVLTPDTIPPEFHTKPDGSSINNSDLQYYLATQIAQDIKDKLDRGLYCPSTGCNIRPKDIMVLCRKRSGISLQIEKELRRLNIQVDGLSRQYLQDHLLAKDLVSMARYVCDPTDDFNTSFLLKTPCIDIWDDELTLWRHLQLCMLPIFGLEISLSDWIMDYQKHIEGLLGFIDNYRTKSPKSNFLDLRDTSSSPPQEPVITSNGFIVINPGETKIHVDDLYSMLQQIDRQKIDLAQHIIKSLSGVSWHIPSDFFQSLLKIPCGNYESIQSCLMNYYGRDIAMTITDQFLMYVKKHEADASYGLDALMGHFIKDQTSIKIEHPDAVRLMTVHGSKGLQAPYVILVNEDMPASRLKPVTFHGDQLIWLQKSMDMSENVRALFDHERDLSTQEAVRLFYVAMTRAEDHLLIASYSKQTPKEEVDDAEGQTTSSPSLFPSIPKTAHDWYQASYAAIEACRHQKTTDTTSPLTLGIQDRPLPFVLDEGPENIASYGIMTWMGQDPSSIKGGEPHLLSMIPPVAPMEETPLMDMDGYHARNALNNQDFIDFVLSTPDKSFEQECGIWIHSFLALCITKKDDAWPQILCGYLRSPQTQALFSAYPNDHEQLESLIKKAIAWPRWRQILDNAIEIHSEQELYMDGRMLRPDLVVMKPNKKIQIIDFKTHISENDDSQKQVRVVPDSYQKQLQDYHAALMAIYPEHTITAALYYILDDHWIDVKVAHVDGAQIDKTIIQTRQ